MKIDWGAVGLFIVIACFACVTMYVVCMKWF